MINALLLVLVLGAIVLAVGVDFAALVTWLTMLKQRRRVK
jgi:hypothetical protein